MNGFPALARVRALARVFALTVPAFGLLGASGDDVVATSKFFWGTWKCAGTAWSFVPLAESDHWTKISYGNPAQPEGTAVMGYVEGLHAWIYRDFHANGSYADLTSPGPVDGRWQWTGPYYPSEGGPALDGRITYTEVTPQRYDRTFEMKKDDGMIPMGNDTCLRTSP